MRSLLLALIFCLFACGEQSEIKILTEEEMTVIMADLMLSDYTLRQFPVSLKDSMKVKLTESLLEIHNLSKVELDSNLYLYSVDFEKFQSLLELVDARLDSLIENADDEITEEVKLPSK